MSYQMGCIQLDERDPPLYIDADPFRACPVEQAPRESAAPQDWPVEPAYHR